MKEKKRAIELNSRIEQSQSVFFKPTETAFSRKIEFPSIVTVALFLSVVVAGTILPSYRVFAANVPVIEFLSDVYISEGQSASVTVRATDAESDPLFIAVTERPLGALFVDNGDGTASFSWRADFLGPLSSVGSPFTVGFLVSDGSGHSARTMQIHVQNLNRAPVVTVVDSVFVEVGDSISVEASVFDPDQDQIIWSMSGSPAGVLLRDSDGSAPAQLQWAPVKADSGSHTISITATDQWGLSTSASATVVVTVGATYTVSVAIDTAFPGEIVSIPVLIKNREPISGFEFSLHYDPSVMSFISIIKDTLRATSFESLTYVIGSPSPGDLKVSGVATIPDTNNSALLPIGDGELFTANFFVSADNHLAGLFLPVIFGIGSVMSPDANTLLDTSGGLIVTDSIVFVSGGVKVKNQSAITRGDINLNGVPFEVADALRFTNYFIDPINFSLNAQQFANSDINSDGIVASIADLVTLISIVLGDGSANPKNTPGVSSAISVYSEKNNNQITTQFASKSEDVKIGGALLTFVSGSEGDLTNLELDINALPDGY